MRIRATVVNLLGLMMVAASSATAEVKLHKFFSDNMVLQRDKPVRVWGTGDKGAEVTVTFAPSTNPTGSPQASSLRDPSGRAGQVAQKKTAKVGEDGNWLVTLDPMKANAKGHQLSVHLVTPKPGEGGSPLATRPLTLDNVVIGDVWFFGRQTYVDISLGSTEAGRVAAAKYKANDLFRAITIKTMPAKDPQADLAENATSGWVKVDPNNALNISGSSFYLGQDLVQELGVPVGIVDVNMNHHFAIGWMSEQGIDDTQKMNPCGDIDWLRKSMPKELEARDSGKTQAELDAENKARGQSGILGLHPLNNPTYPSCGYNAVINPLKNITVKGVLLQLGNDYPFIAYREMEKAGLLTSAAGYGRAWYENYYIIKLGYRITPNTLPYVPGDWRRTFGDKTLPFGLILPPASDLDVLATHNREVRELQRRTSDKVEGIGLILPGMKNIPLSSQPADDKLLAQRCKQWVLADAAGPLFDRMEAKGTKAAIHFKAGTAKGLKASGTGLDFFETAGHDRVYSPAKASIDGDTVTLKSERPILFVRYNWVEKPNQELVNEAGLPALPFSTDAEWEFAWIPPEARPDLPMEYTTTADKWGKSNVAIISGQIDNLESGDSEPIPHYPGPIGIRAAPFGPNIYVKSIEPETPAAGKLLPGDIIYGVNGKAFDDGPGMSTDAPYLALADAITYSETEKGEGKLLLSVRRGTKLMDIELQLQVLGSYSHTTPFDCEKSANIVKNAEDWVSKRYRPEGGLTDAWDLRNPNKVKNPAHPSGMLGSDLLFLMASGNPEHQGLVRRAIYQKFNPGDFKPTPVDDTVQSKPWFTGYDSLLLGEYYHATGDRNVLPILKHMALLSSASQIKPLEDTPPTKEAAQSEEQVGGWRQNYPGDPNRWQSGYGLMPHAGMPCVMGMQLAKEAGLDIDELALKRGLEHFKKGRAEYAFVMYSYGNLRIPGPRLINPAAEASGMLGSDNGKLGTAAALFSLIGEKGTVEICSRNCVYSYNNTRGGHGGMFFNNFWTPVGAWAAGEEGFKHFMKGQTWWRELYRRSDGSFNQAGRGGIGVSYALHYVAPKKRLRILGAPRSAFGTNCPDYMKPAIEAHEKRDYELCEKLIVKYMDENILSPAERPVVDHLLTSVRILRASIEHDLALVENQINEGQYYYASLELGQLKGVVPEDNPRLKAILAVLETEDGQKRIEENFAKCLDLRKAEDAAYAAANPVPRPEKWLKAIPEKTGKWQMKLVEDISNAPEGWTEPEFDDSAWMTATTPISWTMYHTALFRGKFNVEEKSAIEGVRIVGEFFRQGNVVVHLNGKLVAKIDEFERGGGTTYAPLTEYGVKQLKTGENTIAVSSRHLRRWGPARGPAAETVTITVETKGKE